ncbi:MAG: hypothetical protein KF753_09530 [Caldilineaceae bacterium]|nr:hypothetical protein [Caldilineaceae bacterium]
MLPATVTPSPTHTATVMATVTPTATAVSTFTPTATPKPTAPPESTSTATPITPQPILEIPLAGPATFGRPEFSGLAWYGDYLVLLPQYPGRFATGDGALFVLDRAEIEAFVEGALPGPLTPRPLPVDAPGLRAQFPGYEGFESIVFDGERVYLTVESWTARGMLGWIVAGRVEPDLNLLHIDVTSAVAIAPQADLGNMTDEAIVLWDDEKGTSLLTIYEANGLLVNPQPVTHRFATDLSPLASLPLPHVEYRITDATPADEKGNFWAINYFYPGDVKLKPSSDALPRLVLNNLPHVERLVEFQVTDKGIRFSGAPPVYLQLLETDARNWEGIVRLDERGFLLVTDTHPRTILAFVAKP